LEWVLLGERNIADKEIFAKFVKRRKHHVSENFTNGVSTLRIEDGDLTKLGLAITEKLYGVKAGDVIKLLVSGFDLPEGWQPWEEPGSKGKSVSDQLLATLKETTGIDDLDFDKDGDVGILFGSAITFVRAISDPLFVHIYSPILRDVEESPALYARLNDMNANEHLIRFVHRNGNIYGICDISASPYVSEHVAEAFKYFCSIADGMDSLLREEFGGHTTYTETMPSTVKH
jgi:hypothetical protein